MEQCRLNVGDPLVLFGISFHVSEFRSLLAGRSKQNRGGIGLTGHVW